MSSAASCGVTAGPRWDDDANRGSGGVSGEGPRPDDLLVARGPLAAATVEQRRTGRHGRGHRGLRRHDRPSASTSSSASLRPLLIGGSAPEELAWHLVWELDRAEEPRSTRSAPSTSRSGTSRRRRPESRSTSCWAGTATRSRLRQHLHLGSTEEFLEIADQCLELGYPAIKLHGWGDARADADLCQRVRDHVGPDVDLMYDGSAGFDLPDAVYLGHALSEAKYRWYEEPMREFNVTAYRWLAELDIAVLAPETADGVHHRRRLHRQRCVDMVRTASSTAASRARCAWRTSRTPFT